MSANDETTARDQKFDFTSFPRDTLFYDRRTGRERRGPGGDEGTKPDRPPRAATERRAKKERRRRVDPTTFEKQYSDDEIEFMNAMQRFKVQTGKSFPSYGEVLKIASALGYRRVVDDEAAGPGPSDDRGDASADG